MSRSDGKDGGQAFPVPAFAASGFYEDGYHNGPEEGMSLRDYFAAKALGGLIRGTDSPKLDRNWKKVLAAEAYGFADAMLEARSA